MFAPKKIPDVFVIGGGPAGLAAAIAARRRGFSVTLADGAEPPIDKPCGEGLMPETLAALQALGVQVPFAEGHCFRGIRFVSAVCELEADFPNGQGLGVHRQILHRALVEAAEKRGVRLLWKTPVRGITSSEVQLRDTAIAARWIIGADGGNSRVRRWSGLEAAARRELRNATRRRYRIRPWSPYVEIYWGPRSQAYVTPISAQEVCIVILAKRAEDADFERTLAVLPQLCRRLSGAEIAGRERGAITAMHSLRRVSRGNVALVGDASGGVDAITGEGLRLGFRHAEALAEAMLAGDLSGYERAHRRLAQRPMSMGKLMLQMDRGAWLRERTMRAMQNDPALFARLLAFHAGQASPGKLLAAGAQFGWQFLAA